MADLSLKERYPGATTYDCRDGAVHTAKSGSYDPNPWGLHDILGNVAEWTCSVWDEAYEGDERRCAEGSAAQRVFRGGSWFGRPRYVRTSYRFRLTTDYRRLYLGFRLAQDI